MVLYCDIFCMLVAIMIGKRCKRLGFKQYFIIAILTLFQVAIAIYSMYNMEKPPLLYWQH